MPVPALQPSVLQTAAYSPPAWSDQAVGLRRLMAQRTPLRSADVSVLAQDPALTEWMREHLGLLPLASGPAGIACFLLCVHAHPAALPQSLTWAYAQFKQLAVQDAALPPARRLLPRLHFVLVGVQDSAQARQALANMAAAVQQRLGARLLPGAWLSAAACQPLNSRQ